MLTLNGTGPLTLPSGTTLSAAPPQGDRSLAIAVQQAFSTEFGLVSTSSGYQKLPSGLIIQWGSNNGGNPAVAVTLPIAFPTAAIGGIATLQAGGTGANVQSCAVTAISTTSISLLTMDSSGANFTKSIRWIAIGY